MIKKKKESRKRSRDNEQKDAYIGNETEIQNHSLAFTH